MKRAIAGFLLAVVVLLFTTALGLAVIHISNLPYVIDVDLLSISEKSGFSREEILLNYNAVMDYLSPFSDAAFVLPTLDYTAQASYHFDECKILFNNFYLLGLASAVVLVFLTIMKAVSKQTLRISGAVTLAIPVVAGVELLTNFDSTFTFFHSIFFADATWIFDPDVDEIIRILPSEFFMHCAIFIALFWIAGAALQLIIGYSSKKVSKT